MEMDLMYITNDPHIAKIAEDNGVDFIFIDLEIHGKEERQGHLDTVISFHKIEDIKPIKEVLQSSQLLVRVNPIHKNSKAEIDTVIERGADIVMLPYFKSRAEVRDFVKYVDNRSETMLLLETPEAVENIDGILNVSGIDYVHIGLNDLHLGYNMTFMFELLLDGTVENLCNKIKLANIPYGFGGISQLGNGDLPAEKILMEHYRLNSSMAILSRSFYDQKSKQNYEEISKHFKKEISKIRIYLQQLPYTSNKTLKDNRIDINEIVSEIVGEKLML